ncbi:MAG TPA: hypothetical protein VFS76_13480 [Pyrinomonadaceae bacterium]|nr:hypothetical protein [Pyrinomonadaceae bacterium]
MESNGKPPRFEIPDVAPGRIIDLGPIIDPPFIDGVSREAPDSGIHLTDVEYDVLSDIPAAEVAVRAKNTAEADPRVIDALGHRWEFIGVGTVVYKKRDRPDLRVVWYAYDTDQTVEVVVHDGGTKIRKVRIDSSQPPLTDGEQARANELVAAIGRLPGACDGKGLIVEETDPGSPRYGHRLVDLCFNPDNTRLPRWWALVDLSTNELIDAGDIPQGKLGEDPLGGER